MLVSAIELPFLDLNVIFLIPLFNANELPGSSTFCGFKIKCWTLTISIARSSFSSEIERSNQCDEHSKQLPFISFRKCNRTLIGKNLNVAGFGDQNFYPDNGTMTILSFTLDFETHNQLDFNVYDCNFVSVHLYLSTDFSTNFHAKNQNRTQLYFI